MFERSSADKNLKFTLHKNEELLVTKQEESPLESFARAASYSAIVAPAKASAQLVDHIAKTNIASLFNQTNNQEKQYETSSFNWQAQQLGNAVGMLLPFLLARKIAGTGIDKVLNKASAVETTASALRVDNSLIKDAIHSSSSGAVYGALFTPADDAKTQTAEFWQERAAKSICSAATFGLLGAGNRLIAGKLDTIAGNLESLASNTSRSSSRFGALLAEPFLSRTNTALASALRSPITSGAIAGLPGGFISAELSAFERWSTNKDSQSANKWYASEAELKESIASMAYIGAVFGSFGMLGAAVKPEKSSAKLPIEEKQDTHSFMTEEHEQSGSLDLKSSNDETPAHWRDVIESMYRDRPEIQIQKTLASADKPNKYAAKFMDLLSEEQRGASPEIVSQYLTTAGKLNLKKEQVHLIDEAFADWYGSAKPGNQTATKALLLWKEIPQGLKNISGSEMQDLTKSWKLLLPQERLAEPEDIRHYVDLRLSVLPKDWNVKPVPAEFFHWFKSNNTEPDPEFHFRRSRDVLQHWNDIRKDLKTLPSRELHDTVKYWENLSEEQKLLEPHEFKELFEIARNLGLLLPDTIFELPKITPDFVEWSKANTERFEMNDPHRIESILRSWENFSTGLKSLPEEKLNPIATRWSDLSDLDKELAPEELAFKARVLQDFHGERAAADLIERMPDFRSWYEKEYVEKLPSLSGHSRLVDLASDALRFWGLIPHDLQHLNLEQMEALLTAKAFDKPFIAVVRGLQLLDKARGQNFKNDNWTLEEMRPDLWIKTAAEKRGLEIHDLVDQSLAIAELDIMNLFDKGPVSQLPDELVKNLAQMPPWQREIGIRAWKELVRRFAGEQQYFLADLLDESVPPFSRMLSAANVDSAAWESILNSAEFKDDFDGRFNELKAKGRDHALANSEDRYTLLRQYYPKLSASYLHLLNMGLENTGNPKDYIERIQPDNYKAALKRLGSDKWNFDELETSNPVTLHGSAFVNLASTRLTWENDSAIRLLSTFGKQWERWLDLQILAQAVRKRAAKDERDVSTVIVSQELSGLSDEAKAELIDSVNEREKRNIGHDATVNLSIVKREHAESLAQWLFKYFDRPMQDLGVVASRWSSLNETLRKPPYRYQVVLNASRSLNYGEEADPGFAQESARWGVSQSSYPSFEQRFLNSLPTSTIFPLDKEWKLGDLRAKFLPRDDVRGPYLGNHSACCQHPMGVGDEAAWFGQEHPSAGFFVVEDESKNIVAQSLAWESDDGALVFDSIESKGLGTRQEDVASLYNMAAKDLSKRFHTINAGGDLSIFEGTATAREWKAAEKLVRLPFDYDAYTDADEKQFTIAINNDIPERKEPKVKAWLRGSSKEDLESAKVIASKVYESSPEIPDGNWKRSLMVRGNNLVGYAVMNLKERTINDLAVLPEYRRYSPILIREMFKTIRDMGGQWSIATKENSDELNRFLARRPRNYLTTENKNL